jgi:hypothetical protein
MWMFARRPQQFQTTVDGQNLTFEIPRPAKRNSVFVFSLHKAGSTLLNKIVGQASRQCGLPTLNIPNQSVQQGVMENRLTQQAVGPVFMQDGYAFGGFRAPYDFVPREALNGRRKVLLVRDPRDMMVSLYFSVRFSHAIPPTGEARRRYVAIRNESSTIDIDDFVLSDRCRFLANNYRAYKPLIDKDWRVFRYEDVIFSKRKWVYDIASHLGLELKEDRLNRIADQNDVRPSDERLNEHIRQVTPRNHLKYLKPETISALNVLLADILEQYEYELAY